MQKDQHAVTGAFSYSGRYIARKLIDQGKNVITLTNSTGRPNPFGDKITVVPFNFDKPDLLSASLEGVSVLYNTYWIRFNRDSAHERATENTITLFNAARSAGVERIVHISITNPSENSSVEYFRAKARLEKALMESGMSYCILRPAIIFGKEDILVNNIAWSLRHLPVFGMFGLGKYKMQPVYVEDLADLALEQGANRENKIINAIGPETFEYRELIHLIARTIGKNPLILPVPTLAGYMVASIIGKILGDVLMTRDEVRALMNNMLYVDAPPAGKTKLSDWVKSHASTLGTRYAKSRT